MELQRLLFGENPYYLSILTMPWAIPHCHYETELLYCLSGKFHIMLDGISYELSEGDAVFVGSLLGHVISFEVGRAEVLVVEAGDALLGSDYFLYLIHGAREPVIRKEDGREEADSLRKVCRKLCEEYLDRKPGGQWMVKACIYHLFALIVRLFQFAEISDEKYDRRVRQYRKVHDVFTYVSKHYSEPVPLQVIATHMGYEVNYLEKIFKEVSGMPFHRYLNMYRIKMAVQMMQNHEYSISEIGVLCGIGIPKTFSRLFKEVMGVTPSEYRKALLSKY